VHAKVWRTIEQGQGGSTAGKGAAARGVLGSIARYYLSVGQIYLLDNPLLREPLKREHIKPRLLGHWGTSPGLNMLCVHVRAPAPHSKKKFMPTVT
jgi:XFP N-terminal domain